MWIFRRLEKLYDDPVAHFKARAEEPTTAKKAANEPVVIIAHLEERIDKRTSDDAGCLGALVLSCYCHALRIGLPRQKSIL